MKRVAKRLTAIILAVVMVIAMAPLLGSVTGGALGMQEAYAESVYKHFSVGNFDYYESDVTDSYALGSGYEKGVGVSEYNGSGANVTIPKTVEHEGVTYAVTVVGQDFVSWNDVVETVQIPSSVMSIESLAFSQCPSLTDIYIYRIGNCAFQDYCIGYNYDGEEDEYVKYGNVVLHGYNSNQYMKNYADANGLTYEILAKLVSQIDLTATYSEPVYGNAVVHPTFTISGVSGDGLSTSDFTVDEWNSGWYPYRYVEDGEIRGWRYDDTFEDYNTALLSVRIEPDPYEGNLYNFGNTVVTLNGEKLDIVDYSREGYYIIANAKPYDITPSYVYLGERTYNDNYEAGGSVSFDNADYHTGRGERFAKGASINLYAKANEGYEFAGWTDGYGGAFISADNPLTITADEEEETYYAVFQKIVPATGTLCDTVDYTFDEATGTVTLIPTGADGTGSASVNVYYASPFYGNNKIKHVVIGEGITYMNNYVFQDNTIETVSVPSTLEDVAWRCFEECTMEGAGFTVAPGNEHLTSVDGSLVRNGSSLVKFVKKPGQTEYTIPDGITTVRGMAFEYTTLDKLVLRGDDLSVDDYALDYAEIKNLVIEEGVEYINYQRCSICNSSITLPASLETIANDGGVIDSQNVSNIYVASGSKYYTSIDGVLYKRVYEGNNTDNEQIGLELHCYPRGRTDTSFTVPDDVTAIARFALNGRNTLEEITLPLSVSEIGSRSFGYLDGVTVTIKNPECVFNADCFDYSKNITIKGVTGSTAQIFADEHGFTFESIGEGETAETLPNPKNLRWDGTTAKWDPIPGIEGVRYEVKFYEDDGGSEPYNVSYYNTTITDGTTEWNDFIGRMPYTDQDYYFTVRASKSGYYASETVWSPAGHGPIERKSAAPVLEGDKLIYDTDVTLDTPGVYYFSSYIRVYDMDGNVVAEGWKNNSDAPTINLRSYFFDKSIPYGKYKVYAPLSMTYYGWSTTIINVPDGQYVVYDYQELPKVDRIEVTTPEMIVGMKAHLPDGLVLKSYSGSKEIDSVYPDTSYYWNCFEYREEEGSGIDYFGDAGVQKGKYSYSYRLAIEKRHGYTFADDIEILVNGSRENVEVTSVSDDEFNIRYHYPAGTQPLDGIWKKDGSQWHFYDGAENLITNAWAQDNAGWCWLDGSGNITKSKWIKDAGEWYYLNASGYRAQNTWVKDSTGWCFMGPDGKMVKNTWKKDSKGWCYLGANGYMVTNDWAKDSKGWCWIGPDGYMLVQTKWIQVSGEWYHITKGYRDHNKWMKDSKGWCWLQSDGKMLTNGWAMDSKGWCWIGANGYMVEQTKWIKYDGGWYYIEKGYRVQNSWRKDSKGWCYLDGTGRMVTDNWAKDSKGECWIGPDGYMVEKTMLVEFEGETYGIEKGYKVIGGSIEIDGNTYAFDEEGKLIP